MAGDAKAKPKVCQLFVCTPIGPSLSFARCLGQAPTYDLGENICRPLVPLIPRWVHPNHITLTNRTCAALHSALAPFTRVSALNTSSFPSADLANWLLLALTFAAPLTSSPATVYVVCAVVNFGCMVLDCLDGMHARATKQTSKVWF
jgi:hypothetical protein